MDPISFLILSGILTVLACRTAGSAVTDAIAQSKGETPPSLEKWRKRQQDRKGRGEAVEKDPGPWRRRWRMAAEHRTAKAAQKHQARMELLRDNGPDNVAKHKKRLRRRADRWDRINGTAAKWGSASWDAAKTAASKAKEARKERQAWKENARRADVDETTDPGTVAPGIEPPGEQDSGPDADVLPFRRSDQPSETADADKDEESDEADSGANRVSRPPLPHVERPYVPNWSTEANELWWKCKDGEISADQLKAGLADLAGIDLTLAHELGMSASDLSDYTNHAEPPTEAELRERFNIVKPWTPDDDRDGTDDSGGSPATESNDKEGNPTVTAPTHSGEITDLASALAYVTASSSYCSSIAGTFETAQAQADSTAADLERQLATLETAQATLSGEGLAAAAGQLGAVSEHFTALVENMRQVTALLAATQESINSATANLTSAETVFRSQMGLAEEVQSQQEVANRTAFYANA